MKKGIILSVVIAAMAVAVSIGFASQSMANNNTSCVQETSFQSATANHSPHTGQHALLLANDGTIKYLYDNFAGYENNQKVLDEFENPNSWLINDEKGKLYYVDEFYGGNGASAYDLDSYLPSITLATNFSAVQDLTRWEKSGYLTMWLKIGNSQGIDSVYIDLVDNKGNTRMYSTLPNIHVNSTNTFSNDTEFPNLTYPQGNPSTEQWTYYHLGKGWNYLLWRADNFTDTGAVNMGQIKQARIHVKLNDQNFSPQQIIFNDLRIQDGLQKYSNPTHGFWFPPHGRPQYGVYDIDQIGNSSELRLLNVRNTQYPTNGDHARMITNASVPINFAFRVNFTLIQLGNQETHIKIPRPFSMYVPDIPLNAGLRNNTYFRVTYDFEPDWDPGHDWFGAYISLEYNKLGLSSVWPIKRNILQDQEPQAGLKLATAEFSAQNNKNYEMDMIVTGQTTTATIYELEEKCLQEKSEMTYTFNHPRHTDNRYPIAIESTGSMRSIIYEVEIMSLENKTYATKTFA